MFSAIYPQTLTFLCVFILLGNVARALRGLM